MVVALAPVLSGHLFGFKTARLLASSHVPRIVRWSAIDRKKAWGELAVATHREFIYVKPPEGLPDVGCFRLVEAPMPKPADGQVLTRTHFLSIDPYMRRQMGGGHGQYPNPLKLGDAMIGRGAGLAVETRHTDSRVGDAAQGEFCWSRGCGVC